MKWWLSRREGAAHNICLGKGRVNEITKFHLGLMCVYGMWKIQICRYSMGITINFEVSVKIIDLTRNVGAASILRSL